MSMWTDPDVLVDRKIKQSSTSIPKSLLINVTTTIYKDNFSRKKDLEQKLNKHDVRTRAIGPTLPIHRAFT